MLSSLNAKVLLREGAELYYRSTQIRKFLTEIALVESAEYTQLVATLESALEVLQDFLPGTVTNILSIKGLPSEEQESLLLADLNKFSHWFVSIHELLVYLPSRAVLPETTYILDEAFGQSYHDIKPSCILGSIFNALEYDFGKVVSSRLPEIKNFRLKGAKNIVLQLALCERDSPSSWASLAHELAHAIDFQHHYSEDATSKVVPTLDSQLHDLLQNWSSEICADLIAAEVLGPAPILALISAAYCFLPLQKTSIVSPTHPPTKWRVKVVSDYLNNKYKSDFLEKDRMLFENAWNESLVNSATDQETAKRNQQADIALYDHLIKPVADHIASAFRARISNIHTIETNSLERCIQRLRLGRPIGAQGEEREKLRNHIDLFTSATHKDDNIRAEAFELLKHQFLEAPLSMPTILLACHKRRGELLDNACNDPSVFGSRELLESLCTELRALDDVVSNSVGSNMVHRTVFKRIQRGQQ